MVRHNKIDHDVLNQFVATEWEHLKSGGNHQQAAIFAGYKSNCHEYLASNHQDKLVIIGGWWLVGTWYSRCLDPKPKHNATVAFRINLLLGSLDVRSIPECGWSGWNLSSWLADSPCPFEMMRKLNINKTVRISQQQQTTRAQRATHNCIYLVCDTQCQRIVNNSIISDTLPLNGRADQSAIQPASRPECWGGEAAAREQSVCDFYLMRAQLRPFVSLNVGKRNEPQRWRDIRNQFPV